jgi:hypothetical protein
MLQFNLTETIEALLVGILQKLPTEVSCGDLGSQFFAEVSVKSGGGLANLGGGKGGGRAGKSGEEGKLHHGLSIVVGC